MRSFGFQDFYLMSGNTISPFKTTSTRAHKKFFQWPLAKRHRFLNLLLYFNQLIGYSKKLFKSSLNDTLPKDCLIYEIIMSKLDTYTRFHAKVQHESQICSFMESKINSKITSSSFIGLYMNYKNTIK